MKQSEAVYQATRQVLKEKGIQFEDGQNITDVMTTEIRKEVISIVCEGFKAGTVDLKDTESNREKLADEAKLREYTNGLVSNWYRRDVRFNGGETYQPKNPGSRAGSQDDQVKAIRALIKSGKLDEEGMKLAQAKLDERLAEIRAASNKVEIDVDQLPDDLKHLIQH
jgi:hypothetical protein